ncbi:hypothetical protein U729_3194 (plasmid) [Clostridium baratii str. Sullivan]|uniref:Uncharacterized protein n=1 Tax=Clostridium baratii str. Sullivan TaxID=1415775 RepID=A0A0A7G0G0_9CLOT|nr:hypothetical protein [Clostridium baratii]AIY85354.1 hypothetical protein U729_3194 [Clostridium baratii str. Sullivan]
MENNVTKLKEYKDKLKNYEEAYSDLEKKKLVIETNIKSLQTRRDELINEIKAEGFEPSELNNTILDLENNLNVLMEQIDTILSNKND